MLATQDWHTDKHLSFSENGGTWPQHFVQGTKGAELHSELNLPVGSLVIRKSADRRIEARSAFTESKLLRNPAVIFGRARLYLRCSDRADRTRNRTRGQLAGFHHVCG